MQTILPRYTITATNAAEVTAGVAQFMAIFGHLPYLVFLKAPLPKVCRRGAKQHLNSLCLRNMGCDCCDVHNLFTSGEYILFHILLLSPA